MTDKYRWQTFQMRYSSDLKYKSIPKSMII